MDENKFLLIKGSFGFFLFYHEDQETAGLEYGDLVKEVFYKKTLCIEPTPKSPHGWRSAEQRLLRIRRSLAVLSERTQQAFFLHRLEGFSYAEIAQRLGVSVSAVEKHIANAVAVLAMERHKE